MVLFLQSKLFNSTSNTESVQQLLSVNWAILTDMYSLSGIKSM